MYIDNRTKKELIVSAAIIAVVAIAASYVLLLHFACGAKPGGCGAQRVVNTTASHSDWISLQITDPPYVPQNTTSLILSYKGIELHQSGTSDATGSITLNASGSINLLNLTNHTYVVAVAKTQSTKAFDGFMLTGASGAIVIDGVSYPITIPNGTLTLGVPGGFGGANESVLVDLSSSAIQLYGSNQSFTIVPSARTAVISGSNAPLAEGTVSLMNSSERASLGELNFSMVLSGVAIQQNGSVMRITARVIDTGSGPVTLKHLLIYGVMAVYTNNSVLFTAPMQRSLGGGGGGPPVKGRGPVTNSTANKTKNATSINFGTGGLSSMIARDLNLDFNSSRVNTTVHDALEFQAAYHDQLNFVVLPGNVLSLPFTAGDAASGGGLGLTPGEETNLTYYGIAQLGSSHMTVAFIPNQTYDAVLIGDNGSYSETPAVAGT